MPLLLWPEPTITPPTSGGLQFFDETGLNPLPAGVRVKLYAPNVPITNAAGFVSLLGPVVGQAYITAGGYCNLFVQPAVTYVVVFDMSGQAPQQAAFISGLPKLVSFAGAAAGATTIVVVSGYRSPTLSKEGYALAQTALLPTKWANEAARQPGGNYYNVALLLGAMFAQADSFGEIIHGALRLPSSVGSQIDSWARDFFGPFLPRFSGESDAAYIARIVVMLQTPKTTLQEIQAVVIGFYASIAAQSGLGSGQGQGLDLTGALEILGGLDVSGPFSAQGGIPYIFVWDRQAQPNLANQYNVNPNNDDGSFVIQVGLANAQGWMLDNSFLDDNTYLINPNTYTLSSTPPDARLGALVNLVKAGGTQPLYLTADLTP